MNHFMAAALSAALSISMTASSSPLTALGAKERQPGFFTFFSGPGVEAVSSGDEYSEYQWALRNMGNLQRTERKLNIRTLDSIYVHYGESGIDGISCRLSVPAITTPFRRTPYWVLISILRKPGSSMGSSPINALSLWL